MPTLARVARASLVPFLVGCSSVAWAQAQAPDVAGARPARLHVSYERARLPGGEHMGLVGTGYLVEVAPGWSIGPAAYGALTGDRGGLFVVGVEGSWYRRLMGPLGFEAGFFAGGGGGAAAPVGGGLMLRPQASLLWDLGAWRAGVSYARVRFANGSIDSSQWGLTFNRRLDFGTVAFGSGGSSAANAGTGIGFDRVEGVLTAYRPSSSVRTRSGLPMPSRRIGLVGVRMTSFLTPEIYGGVEAAGAGSGGVSGYAELLATLGFEKPVDANGAFTVGARAAVGMGGGGDVSTGGGLLLKGAALASYRVSRDVSLGLEAGWVHAPDGAFRAPYAAVNVNWDLDQRFRGAVGSGDVTRTEWIAGIEHYRAERRDGTDRTLENVVLKVNRFVSPNVYLTGQVRSAFRGDAGGFTAGLAGIGWHSDPWNRLSAGVEVLAGAGGGGGVDSSGLLVEPNAFVAYQLNPAWTLRAGAGMVRSSGGRLSSPMAELSVGYAFGVCGR